MLGRIAKGSLLFTCGAGAGVVGATKWAIGAAQRQLLFENDNDKAKAALSMSDLGIVDLRGASFETRRKMMAFPATCAPTLTPTEYHPDVYLWRLNGSAYSDADYVAHGFFKPHHPIVTMTNGNDVVEHTFLSGWEGAVKKFVNSNRASSNIGACSEGETVDPEHDIHRATLDLLRPPQDD